jgi:hypothetical protein
MATVTPIGPRIRERKFLAALEEAWAERERELEERENHLAAMALPPRLRLRAVR